MQLDCLRDGKMAGAGDVLGDLELPDGVAQSVAELAVPRAAFPAPVPATRGPVLPAPVGR